MENAGDCYCLWREKGTNSLAMAQDAGTAARTEWDSRGQKVQWEAEGWCGWG